MQSDEYFEMHKSQLESLLATVIDELVTMKPKDPHAFLVEALHRRLEGHGGSGLPMSTENLRALLRAKGKSEKAIDAIIKTVDSDGDGTITSDELKAGLRRLKTEDGFVISSTLDGCAHVAMGASSICTGTSSMHIRTGRALLIIDPQVDFVTGSLAVPGAVEDTARTIELLARNEDAFEKIYVTLDTHHATHIAHAGYWIAADGVTVPTPFTQISAEQVRTGVWRPRAATEAAWALEYCTRLEAKGRFTLTIWPTHCLLGSPGHAVHPPLADALNAWATKRSKTISWVLKGQNNRTEMYSALKAEVELTDDPATSLNQPLIDALAAHTQVAVCGQAKSHCVAETARDLLSGWPAGRAADIVLLTDAASPVVGFEAAATAFEKDMLRQGVTCRTVSQYAATL